MTELCSNNNSRWKLGCETENQGRSPSPLTYFIYYGDNYIYKFRQKPDGNGTIAPHFAA
jgi:hypothetical protein